MMRWLMGLAAALALVACAGPSAPTEQGGGALLTEPHPEAMRTDGYLDFLDLSLRPVSAGPPPTGPHVRGWILGGLFTPAGEVANLMDGPPPGRIGSRGYLELRTRAFFRPDVAGMPSSPFVEGFQDTETGGFYPTSPIRPAPTPASPEGAPEEAVSDGRP